MDAYYATEISHAFVANERDLKKLCDLLTDRIGVPEIVADCADGITRKFSSLKELLAYDNVKDKEVQRLRISASSGDLKKHAKVDLAGRSWRRISLDLHGRDDVISRLRADVLDLLSTMRPWYSAVHRIDFVVIFLVSLVVIWLGSVLVVAMKWVHVEDAKPMGRGIDAWIEAVLYGTIVTISALAFGLNRFRDSLFPRAVFLIGHAKARFEHLERVQWGVVISFIVSLIGGLVMIAMEAIWN